MSTPSGLFSHSFANIISMKISNILRTDKTLDFSFYIIGWVCLILALVLGLAWKSGYFLWIFPPDGCVLHNLTGYYCPGCGGTRAIHALLHGHIVRSFFYHPIVVYTAVFFRLVYAVPDHRKSIPRTFCHRDALS